MTSAYTARDYFNDPSRPRFLEWGLKIDRLLNLNLGLGVLDLPDQDYSAMFEDGMRETAVVAHIIDEFHWD